MASRYEGGQEEARQVRRWDGPGCLCGYQQVVALFRFVQVLQRISSATAELETGVKALGTQSDGIELREDLNSKKDAILADIETMKSILQNAKERCVSRGVGSPWLVRVGDRESHPSSHQVIRTAN